MLAYLRVLAFYIGTAALLTWGLFALGLVDNLEMPGFEGPRSGAPTAVAPAPQPSPVREIKQPPVEPVKTVAAPPPPPAPVVVAPPVATPPPQPPVNVPVVVPPPAPPAPDRTAVLQPAPKAERVEPMAPRAPEPPKPAPLPKANSIETLPAPVAAPVVVPPAAPPVQPPRTVEPPPAPPRAVVAPAQPPVTAPPQAQDRPRAPQRPPVETWWEAHRRIAGYGFDALIDQLETTKPSQDDIPCIMLRELRFRAGTAQGDATLQTQIGLLAKILAAFPDRRVEIGSRLGPGRPMATDPALRAGRVSAVRDGLVRLGVPASRVLVEPDGTFERVSEDARRLGLARTQSMGVCLRE